MVKFEFDKILTIEEIKAIVEKNLGSGFRSELKKKSHFNHPKFIKRLYYQSKRKGWLPDQAQPEILSYNISNLLRELL